VGGRFAKYEFRGRGVGERKDMKHVNKEKLTTGLKGDEVSKS